jgi:superfamily II DNA helicase RecQ
MVDDLVDHLNAQGYSADRLHGDMTQMMRDRVMQKFRKSGIDFSWPLTLPPEALMWTTSRSFSITTCLMTARTMSIA